MAKETLSEYKRTITFTIRSKAKSGELALRKEIEKFINSIILVLGLRIPKNQFNLLLFKETDTVIFTEKIIKRKGKRYAVLFPGSGEKDFFSDAKTGKYVEIIGPAGAGEPSLLKRLEQVGAVYVETENWLDLLMPDMKSSDIISSGRGRF